MSKMWKLFKVIFKNGGNQFDKGASTAKNKKHNKIKNIGLIVLLIACFLPYFIGNIFIITKMYDTLVSLHMESIILGGAIAATSFIILIFGMFSVISIYYFSDDIESLIVLPVRPYTILGAKFFTVVVQQYFIEALILLPVLIGYGIKSGSSVLFILYSIVAFLFIPIIPLVISSIISMVLMSFIKFTKNKDAFKTVTSMLGIIIALGFNFAAQKFSTNTSKDQLKDVINSVNQPLNSATSIFPASKLVANSLLSSTQLSGLLGIFLFIIISVAIVGIFLVIGESVYLKGAIGIMQTSSKRKKLNKLQINKASIKSSGLKAYTLKEIRLLFRTSAYFTQCVVGGLIVPVILFASIMMDGDNPPNIGSMNQSLVLTFGFAAFVFFSSMNSIAVTSISREGNNLFVSKYIPLDYKTQINAKVLSALFVSGLSLILTVILGMVTLKISIFIMILILIPSILCIIGFSYAGVFLDLMSPKLGWDSEIKAIKQNLNTLVSVVVTLVLLGLTIFLFITLNLNVILEFLILTIVFGLFAFIMYKLVTSKAPDLYRKIM